MPGCVTVAPMRVHEWHMQCVLCMYYSHHHYVTHQAMYYSVVRIPAWMWWVALKGMWCCCRRLPALNGCYCGSGTVSLSAVNSTITHIHLFYYTHLSYYTHSIQSSYSIVVTTQITELQQKDASTVGLLLPTVGCCCQHKHSQYTVCAITYCVVQQPPLPWPACLQLSRLQAWVLVWWW